MLYNIILPFIIYINFLNFFANCEGEISRNQVDLLLHSYHNDILKKSEEIEQIKINGTVSKYNILFNLKRYTMNIDKKMIERDLERLQHPENYKYKLDESKLVKDINAREKSFSKKYKEVLNTVRQTNKLYQKIVHTIKMIFIFFICFIIIATLITIGIMVYITSPRFKNYSRLQEDESQNNGKNNTSDSTAYKVVKILNNFVQSEKKIK